MLTNFYTGKTILLTGATGFLGKVVLEKVLRSLPVVKTIYLAITPKGGAQSEYNRFQEEIMESQIFDRLKLELGMKNFIRLVQQKVKVIPFDLLRLDLGITKQLRDEITQNLNVIINAAASINFDEKLDYAVRLNTTGPLLLLKLAEECAAIEALLQVSTTTVNCDRTGYVEETLYDSGIDWQSEYNKLVNLGRRDLDMMEKQILGKFPNAHCYSKRMTEHLLLANNTRGIPIIIMRPSILTAALDEPVKGWTDTVNFMSGVTQLVGLGILT